jgi:hypothetical protein
MRVVSVELVLKQKTSQDQVDQNQNRMLLYQRAGRGENDETPSPVSER